MPVTISLRSLVVFATGLAVALVTVFVFQAWRAEAAPGDSDTTFVPITPCRLIDTRAFPNRVGPFASFGATETKTVAARGTNGNCTIPADAVGLATNVTAVGATENTFVTVWGAGNQPTAANLNPRAGGAPTPNSVTTGLDGSGNFRVFNRAGTVDIVIDINGYYTKSSLEELAADVGQLQSDLAALESTVAGLQTQFNNLEGGVQAFAVSDSTTVDEALDAPGDAPESIVSVSVTAPADGDVTLVSSAYVTNSAALGDVVCVISEGVPGTLVGTDAGVQWYELPRDTDTDELGNFSTLRGHDDAMLNGTRSFSISSGATTTYHLACREDGGDGTVLGADLVAIYTPSTS